MAWDLDNSDSYPYQVKTNETLVQPTSLFLWVTGELKFQTIVLLVKKMIHVVNILALIYSK